MSYTSLPTVTAGDFIRASWATLVDGNLDDHESRIITLEGSGAGDVVGPSASVASEIALYDGTTGKLIKRATTTGILKGASGVLSAATAGTDYVSPSSTESLTNKTIESYTVTTGMVRAAGTLALTDAQTKALPTTPITLVAAPGSGKTIVPISVAMFENATAGAYTNINGTFSGIFVYWLGDINFWTVLGIVDDSTATPTLNKVTTFLSAAKHLMMMGPYHDNYSQGWNIAPVPSSTTYENKALAIAADNNGSGNYTGGNSANSLTVYFEYWIIG